MDFGTVIIVVSILAVLIAAGSYWGSGRIYSGLGREGGLDMRREPDVAPESAEAREEIRQMLEAKSERRRTRGGEPLDVEAQLASLTSGPSHAETAGAPGRHPLADQQLREEVRQLVIARNERRVRQGKDPLDVDAEIERQLRSLEG
jgi:AcrR family transcriptional regulator